MSSKSFQKKKVRLYVAALSFLIVAFCFFPILRVYAASVGESGDYINTGTLSSSHGQIAGIVRENTDIYTYKVPIYMSVTSFDNTGYFVCGYIGFTSPYTFKCGGNDILPNYFESSPELNTIYYANKIQVHFSGDFVQNYPLLVGYFVFNIPISQSDQSFVVNPVSLNISSSDTVFRCFRSRTYQNMVENIATAINNSTDIQSIIDELYIIRNNSVLLADVVDNLENINGILGNIYNYMATMNTTQLNSMRQLVYALSGVDLSTTSASALSQATYNRWVQLIYDAINYQGPDSSSADQAADNLEDAHEANDVAQDSAYQAADTAMQNVNFNVTVPNGLTNAALTIGNYITSIYGQLGSDLQFLITATLTIGLITVILGVINRYPKNTYTTESETVSTGERNGKKFSSSYKTTTKRTRHR